MCRDLQEVQSLFVLKDVDETLFADDLRFDGFGALLHREHGHSDFETFHAFFLEFFREFPYESRVFQLDFFVGNREFPAEFNVPIREAHLFVKVDEAADADAHIPLGCDFHEGDELGRQAR